MWKCMLLKGQSVKSSSAVLYTSLEVISYMSLVNVSIKSKGATVSLWYLFSCSFCPSSWSFFYFQCSSSFVSPFYFSIYLLHNCVSHSMAAPDLYIDIDLMGCPEIKYVHSWLSKDESLRLGDPLTFYLWKPTGQTCHFPILMFSERHS